LIPELVPSSIHLPKVDSPEDVAEFVRKFKKINFNGSDKTRIGLIMFIESAQAFVNIVEICKKAQELSKGNNTFSLKSFEIVKLLSRSKVTTLTDLKIN